MKAKDLAYGGLMIAVFLSIDFIFRINVRDIQSYLEIPKTIIVAVFIDKAQRRHWLSYASSCFLASLIFFSLPDTLIYNVPSIVCGCILGLQNDEDPMIKNFLVLMIVNFAMVIYEMLMYGLFMQINLFAVYQSQIMVLLEEITGGIISDSVLIAGFLLYYSSKAVISAMMIFAPYRIVYSYIRKMGNRNQT